MEETSQEHFTRLLLIRHGQTQHNITGVISGHSDVPINENGHQQAQLMAERVKEHFPLAAIYASPLLRAMQTAQHLSQAVNLPIQPNPDLIEYGFGELSDQPLSDLQNSKPELYRQIEIWNEAEGSERPSRPHIEGIEPLEAFKMRMQSFTDLLWEKHRGQQVAAVTHGGFIKSYVYYLVGGDFSRYVPFWVDNTSLTLVDFYKKNAIIRFFNDSSHTDTVFDHSRPRLL